MKKGETRIAKRRQELKVEVARWRFGEQKGGLDVETRKHAAACAPGKIRN